MIKGLFGNPTPLPAEATRARISEAAAGFPTLTFRIYRTLAGYRIAIVNKRISPTSAEAAELYRAFGADPLYVKLCANQQSFRARLTPKHWRCGIEKPPAQFPFETSEAQSIFEIWKRNYDRTYNSFAACHFVEQIGTASATSEHARLLRIHDSTSGADSQRQLA